MSYTFKDELRKPYVYRTIDNSGNQYLDFIVHGAMRVTVNDRINAGSMSKNTNTRRVLDKRRLLNKCWGLNGALICKSFALAAIFGSGLTYFHYSERS